MYQNLKISLLCGLIFLLAFSGCSLILTRPHEPALEHTVRYKGETTALLSTWYTGTPANARKIRKFNGLTLSKLKLRVGQEILIPKRLLIRSSPPPKSFVLAAYGPKSTESTSVKDQIAGTVPSRRKAPIDLADASPSNLVSGNQKSAPQVPGEFKRNQWIQEELERDSIHEAIIRK